MIILASSSPRRKEILSSIIPNFKIIPSSYDEKLNINKNPIMYVKNCAYNKGVNISKENKNDYVISCDTIVYFNNQILLKPKDKLDCFNTLKLLQNNTHFVYSVYYIFFNGNIIKEDFSIAKVFIEPLNDKQINTYIISNLPFDKAGSYGIQDKKYINCKIIEGDYYTVVGLNKNNLKTDLELLKLI